MAISRSSTLRRGHTHVVGENVELLNRVRAERRRLKAEGPSFVRSDGDFQRVSIPASDADVLRDLILAERAATVIEIGLAYGSSALAIAEALVLVHGTNAHHLVIDAYQEHFHSAGWDTIVAAGVTEICSFVPRRSQLALPRLVEEGMSADAAFVDGSHVFHNVFVDLAFLRELVRPGGLVVLDDCGWPSVATAVRYFEVNAGWQRDPTESDTGLRAYRLPDPPVEPSFENFQHFGLHAQG